MPPHFLTNFEKQKNYENGLKFNGVYSRNNLSKINDEAYAINLGDYKSIGTQWIVLLIIIMLPIFIVLELNYSKRN